MRDEDLETTKVAGTSWSTLDIGPPLSSPSKVDLDSSIGETVINAVDPSSSSSPRRIPEKGSADSKSPIISKATQFLLDKSKASKKNTALTATAKPADGRPGAPATDAPIDVITGERSSYFFSIYWGASKMVCFYLQLVI